ncbi:MAG: hypothetical protein ABF247_12020, partial [Nonlabens sp.]|uniref:hypothetical protein n=1 Tax=Nonlabens sp. TaxID=1888209 RepID=UPI00321B7FED
QKGDSLYVFAGRVEDPTDVLDSKFAPKSVWQLNLETLEWENIGEHAVDNYFSIFESPLQFHTEDKLVFLNKDINEVDIINNKVTRYKIDNFKSLIKIIYHKGSGNVSYVYSTTNEEIFVASEPYGNFKGELIETIPFFKASIPKTRLFLILICVGILLLLIYLAYYKRLKTVNSKEEVILYDAKNDTFSYNNKTIKTLGQFKKQLLIGFMEYGERYILLNELNDLLNKYGDKNENHTALQKRRETLLKQLKNDLALVLNISEDKVFSVRKYKYDRRLKEIKLEIKIIKK